MSAGVSHANRISEVLHAWWAGQITEGELDQRVLELVHLTAQAQDPEPGLLREAYELLEQSRYANQDPTLRRRWAHRRRRLLDRMRGLVDAPAHDAGLGGDPPV